MLLNDEAIPKIASGQTHLGRAGFLSLFAVVGLTLVLLMTLFVYKWGAAFQTITRVESSGIFTPRPALVATTGLPVLLASGARTINYLWTVWPALLLGVLIAGLVRAFISPMNVANLLGSSTLRQQLIGGLMGMPLMLCSCCIAPIFSSLYTRGARLGSALALMFSSPSLNVAALALTFLLFPHDMAFARLGMAMATVFLLPVLIERFALKAGPNIAYQSNCPSDGVAPRNAIGVIQRWVSASGDVALKTLPFIVLGVYASGLLMSWFERPVSLGYWTPVVIAGVALLATLMALPTFFEIPFAMLLAANGFPQGAVVALLFAGPAINMASLVTLARVSSRQVALATLVGVWAIATIGALLLELWAH